MNVARVAAVVLGLFLLLAGGLGCSARPAAVSGEIDLGPLPTVSIEYDLPHMTIEDWTNASDLVVAGTVVKVNPPRWNSDDGKSWKPRGENDPMAVVYQTFYVQPEEILKGAPQWGTPVAFRAVWWNSPSGGGPLSVGDLVAAFGQVDPERYGGGEYQPADAYWLMSEKNSLWVKQGDDYVNQGILKDEAERTLTLDELKTRMREGGGPTTLGMWDPARESIKVGWGETATVDGVLQVTATAPQPDPSARPVESAPDGIVVYCVITIRNIGSHPRSYDQSWLALMSENEGWGGGSDGLQTSVTPALLSGTLEPGDTVTGVAPFQFSPEEVSSIHTLRFDTWPTRKTEKPVVLVEWGSGEY